MSENRRVGTTGEKREGEITRDGRVGEQRGAEQEKERGSGEENGESVKEQAEGDCLAKEVRRRSRTKIFDFGI